MCQHDICLLGARGQKANRRRLIGISRRPQRGLPRLDAALCHAAAMREMHAMIIMKYRGDKLGMGANGLTALPSIPFCRLGRRRVAKMTRALPAATPLLA